MEWTRRTVRAVIAAVAMGPVAILSSCARSTARTGDPLLSLPVPDTVQVRTGTVPGLGTVLTDSQGHTLYMFPPDARRQVRCTGACAGTWPPLVIGNGRRPSAAGQVDAAELGTIADPNTGARVVTYGGYPLYRYAGDLASGVANGQGLFSDGGPWYALSSAAQPITTPPSGTSS